MPLPINRNQPLIMHVDLNSCFATIEQQANPLYRGKPLVVAAYTTPGGCVVAPSIEAKQYGIKTGMTVRDAEQQTFPVPELPELTVTFRQAMPDDACKEKGLFDRIKEAFG
jgi:hypothetical protein